MLEYSAIIMNEVLIIHTHIGTICTYIHTYIICTLTILCSSVITFEYVCVISMKNDIANITEDGVPCNYKQVITPWSYEIISSHLKTSYFLGVKLIYNILS